MGATFAVCESTGFYLRVALVGPSGSGKTYTALAIATGLGLERVGIIDTENRSARRYAKIFGQRFHSLELARYAPGDYIEAIRAAEGAGIQVLVIDSLSHAWMGRGGVLEMVDQSAKRQARGGTPNSFSGWREVTPEHNRLVEALVQCRMHLFVTMRVKTEYVVEKDDKGKSVPRKVGMAPVQRDGLEYEFDVVGEMTQDHDLMITKSRCPAVTDQIINRPGAELAEALRTWVDDAGPIRPDEPAAHERQIDWLALISGAADETALDLVIADLEGALVDGKAPAPDSAQGKAISAALDIARERLAKRGASR